MPNSDYGGGPKEPLPPMSSEMQVEDIADGLRRGYELRPTPERIRALTGLGSDDPVIREMIEIWQEGHGVLPLPGRAESVERARKNVRAWIRRNCKFTTNCLA